MSRAHPFPREYRNMQVNLLAVELCTIEVRLRLKGLMCLPLQWNEKEKPVRFRDQNGISSEPKPHLSQLL